MNRRDVLYLVIFVVIWGIFFTITMQWKDTGLLITAFTIFLAGLTVLYLIIQILSSVIPKFGTWGDKKIFGSKKTEEKKAPEENKPLEDKDRELLLSDLSSRLPYGVKCKVRYSVINETTFGEIVEMEEDDEVVAVDIENQCVKTKNLGVWSGIEQIRPYLRSLDSITDEEQKDLIRKFGLSQAYTGYGSSPWHNYPDIGVEHVEFYLRDIPGLVNWLIKNQFDYQNLIYKKLAIEI